jgi:hypothetical protein
MATRAGHHQPAGGGELTTALGGGLHHRIGRTSRAGSGLAVSFITADVPAHFKLIGATR